MPKTSATDAAVRAVRRVRAHSRASTDLKTRALLIDVERWIIALMEPTPAGQHADPDR